MARYCFLRAVATLVRAARLWCLVAIPLAAAAAAAARLSVLAAATPVALRRLLAVLARHRLVVM